MRKVLIAVLVAYAAAGVSVGTVVIGSGPPKDKVIKLTAKKFEYSPAEISCARGSGRQGQL